MELGYVYEGDALGIGKYHLFPILSAECIYA